MSQHKFEVGEIAILTAGTNPKFRHYIGMQVTILAQPSSKAHFGFGKGVKPGKYLIEIPGHEPTQTSERNLRKLPPKADDNRQVISWDKCLFKPALLDA